MRESKYRRARGRRSQKKTILILCQGTVTEPQCFASYRKNLRASWVKIEKKACDPRKLTKKALAYLKEQEYSEVFVVLDRDESPDDQLNFAKTACASNRACHLVLSNPAFDVWLWWHLKPGNDRELLLPDIQKDLWGCPQLVDTQAS